MAKTSPLKTKRAAQLALLVCAFVALPHAYSQPGELPFNGRHQGQFSFTPMTPTPGIKTVEIRGSGPATIAGMSQTLLRGDVDLDENLRPTARPPGSWTMTAANGDTLVGTFVWRGTPTTEFGVFTLTGTYRITGGTGRFRNATGTGTGTGSLNAVLGLSTFTWEGTLVLGRPR